MSNAAPSPIRVLAFAGSLRAGSYNKATLRAAQGLAPEGMVIEPFDIAPLPMYNADIKEVPPLVAELWAKMAACQAVLFVTPEYNFSIPGGLKNAIDWFSRDPARAFAGKPCAIMGATTSLSGTVRAQSHLRLMCVFLDMHPINKPEVFLRNASALFDAQGTLTDAKTGEFIGQLLVALGDWTRRIAG